MEHSEGSIGKGIAMYSDWHRRGEFASCYPFLCLPYRHCLVTVSIIVTF